MAEDGKATAESKYFPVRWNGEDWALIDAGIPLLKAETHMDVSPTDFIRTAVRRLHEALVRDTEATAPLPGPAPDHAGPTTERRRAAGAR